MAPRRRERSNTLGSAGSPLRRGITYFDTAEGYAGSESETTIGRALAGRSETTQCRYGCSDCAGACPHGVSIPDALRARMYAEDYRAPGLVSAAIAEAGNLAACLGCDGSPCMRACPHGIEIGKLTRRAAALA